MNNCLVDEGSRDADVFSAPLLIVLLATVVVACGAPESSVEEPEEILNPGLSEGLHVFGAKDVAGSRGQLTD